MFAVQTLCWAYDKFKGSLKKKADDGGLTDIEVRQLRLLDYPASKQFLICVAGDLREELAGTKIPNPGNFEVREDCISAEAEPAVDAWTLVLQAIVPTMVQTLPQGTDEYQVARSTEHTQAVSKATKGIVAGVPVLQTSFANLRNILKPQ